MPPHNQKAIKRLVSLIDANKSSKEWEERCDPSTLGRNGRVYLENRLLKTLNEGIRIGQLLAREGHDISEPPTT